VQQPGDQFGNGEPGSASDATGDDRPEQCVAFHLTIVAPRRVREDDDVVTSSDKSALPLVGVGTDVHALVAGRLMRIAGLDWPDEPVGPAGHSDGDVVAHAACDALLSAAALGDLGSAFGTSDPRWADATGIALLGETAKRVRDAGYVIGNVAVQLVGNRPRLGDRRAEAESVLAAACGAPVHLTATTTDGLGLTGRGEGIAAVATAIVAPT
jgi:2-C-methyl-D-erythritol 2,4-cyclodiphosphate synthase